MRNELKNDLIKIIHANGRRLADKLLTFAMNDCNGERSYICPFCGHGENGNGLCNDPKYNDGNGFICHACDFKGDILDIYSKTHDVKLGEAIEQLAPMVGINITNGEPNDTVLAEIENQAKQLDEQTNEYKATQEARKAERLANKNKFERYITESALCLQNSEKAKEARAYLLGRGVSLDLATKYRFGYDENENAVIIPSSNDCYCLRYLDPKHNPQKAFARDSITTLFNADLLNNPPEVDNPIFITEGAITALSFEAIGYNAIALNGVKNYTKLVELLEANPIKNTLVLCLDNDLAGANTTDLLRSELNAIGANYLDGRATLYGDKFVRKPTKDTKPRIDDANDLLLADKEVFADRADSLAQKGKSMPDTVAEYAQNNYFSDLEADRKFFKTGFENFDKQVDGLMRGRLYVIGAISSLGKTTFCYQLGNQLAEQGNHVLYFSMEQGRKELFSKSVVREAYKISNGKTCLTPTKIGKGEIDDPYFMPALESCINKYKTFSIIDCGLASNIEYIKSYIKKYQRQNNATPIVIIDYLQLLRPIEDKYHRATTKETVDEAMQQLKELALFCNIPIVAISSFNRLNYATRPSFESFKESGNIEYTADAILALYLSVLDQKQFDDTRDNTKEARRKAIEEAKEKQIRDVALHSLKFRGYPPIWSIYFKYDCAHDVFTPGKAPTANEFETI